MKTIRNIIFGFIIGVMTMFGIVAFGTDIIKNTYFNSDLKLAINNHQVSDIRIVTVELEGEQYGRNYYSIADLIKAINDYGGVSAKVDFDSATKTTIVEIREVASNNSTSKITPVPTSIESNNQGKEEAIMSVVPLNKYGHPDFSEIPQEQKPPVETDGTYHYFIYNEIKYIFATGDFILNIPRLKLPEPFSLESPVPVQDGKFYEGLQLYKSDENGKQVIINDIPYAWYSMASNYCIPYDYYVNNIIPIIEGE